jgi:hypothetical protein
MIMHTLIFGVVPLVLLFTAPIVQIILSRRKLNNNTIFSLGSIAAISFILGIVFPVAATYIALCGLSPDIKCATGIIGIAPLGIFITIVTTPVISLIFYLMDKAKRKASISYFE